MKTKRGQQGNLTFTAKLIIAGISLLFLTAVGIAFASLFLPQEIDPIERIQVIGGVLSSPVSTSVSTFGAPISIEKDEYIVIYKKGYSGCGSSNWPEVNDDEFGVCSGSAKSNPREIGATCEKFVYSTDLGTGVLPDVYFSESQRNVNCDKELGCCITPNKLTTYILEYNLYGVVSNDDDDDITYTIAVTIN